MAEDVAGALLLPYADATRGATADAESHGEQGGHFVEQVAAVVPGLVGDVFCALEASSKLNGVGCSNYDGWWCFAAIAQQYSGSSRAGCSVMSASQTHVGRRCGDRHTAPALGALPLDKLSVEDLDLFYAQLLTSGRIGGDSTSVGLSPKTVRNIHLMLNKALADAHRTGTVVRNVAALADAPSLKARKRLSSVRA